MKLPLLLGALLAAGAAQAQRPARRPAARPATAAARPLVLPGLQAGDTCYVASQALHLRGQPNADGKPHLAFEHADQLVVQEVSSADWVLVQYTSGDVGIIGYVRRQYLSRTKPPLLPHQLPHPAPAPTPAP